MYNEKNKNVKKPLKTQFEMLSEYKKRYPILVQKCKNFEAEIEKLYNEKIEIVNQTKRTVQRARQDADNARSRAKRLAAKLEKISNSHC